MALPNGTDVLVIIDGDVVGCQRDATFDETVDPIDVSCKDNPERAVEYGRYSSEVTLDAIYVPSDVAQAAIRSAQRNRTKVTLRRSENAVDVEEATAVVTSRSLSAPDQGEAVVSMSFAIDGAWASV